MSEAVKRVLVTDVERANFDAEAAEYIKSLSKADTELAHSEADRVLCDALRKGGYPKTAAAFEALEKWYA